MKIKMLMLYTELSVVRKPRCMSNNVCDCLLHKMLRQTAFTTIMIQDYNNTYPISSMIGVRPVLMSNDHRPGAALDNRTGGGVPNMEESTICTYLF